MGTLVRSGNRSGLLTANDCVSTLADWFWDRQGWQGSCDGAAINRSEQTIVLERDMHMKHQPRFGSSEYAAVKEAAKLRALICDLDRVVRILENDVATEEAYAGVSNPRSGAYPILARVIAARRDNLKETIAALERRLAPEPVVAG